MKKSNRAKIFHGYYVTLLLVAGLSALTYYKTAVFETETSNPNQPQTVIRATENISVDPNQLVFTRATESSADRSAPSWHEVLFLATPSDGFVPDLYRAEVRLDHQRTIIGIRSIKNLTHSPAGDDYQLRVSLPYAVLATKVLGQVRSVTLFDFTGQPEQRSTNGWSTITRALARLSNFIETGQATGIGRTSIRFPRPVQEVELAFTGQEHRPKLALRWLDRRDGIHKASIDPATGETDHQELSVSQQVRLPKRPILWTVDTVRSASWIGPGPIEWLEGRFFALQDTYRRLRYALFGEAAELAEAGDDQSTPGNDPPIADGLEIGEENPPVPWPPPPIKPPVFSRKRANEGRWLPQIAKYEKNTAPSPPLIYRSFTRPDLRRPYVRVHLFAMDMRRLELHMVAGYEDPQPTTGSQGQGHFPKRPDLLSRIVVAFNGAFKTMHGAYGMMVERDVLIPPKARAATIATFDDGRVAMGSWPKGAPIVEQMVSFRQNMDPLVEDQIVNPRRRYLWGFTLEEDITEMYTVRSGICTTDSGTLIYAWGDDLTAETLGIAMNAAGCVYGMHLDMNPFHTAFIHYRFPEGINPDRPKFDSELVLSDMRYSVYRYVRGAPKDFFFLARKKFGPSPDWEHQDLAQPAPAMSPAIFRRTVGECQLVAADLSRIKLHLEPGTIPSELAVGLAPDPTEPMTDNLLVRALLGPWSPKRGQLVNGSLVARLDHRKPAVAITPDQHLFVGPCITQEQTTPPFDDGIQADWLICEGQRQPKSGPVLAIGQTPRNWLMLGIGPGDELTAVLEEYGIDNAAAFELNGDPAGAIRLRTANGMVDLDGTHIRQLSTHQSSLSLLAQPTSSGT